MSERFKGCTIVFEVDLSQEEAEHLAIALQHIRGVGGVTLVTANTDDYMARRQVKFELHKTLLKAIGEIL